MSENPIKIAQVAARAPRAARFYETVSVANRDGRHVVLLDGRDVRTPGRRLLALPNAALAEAVAEEWRAQDRTIEPETMPMTRLVNSSIDGVAEALEEVRSDVRGFADADLVCYRAEGPEGLVAAQQAHWDPLVDWARAALGIRLVLAQGIMHVAQAAETPRRIDEELSRHEALGVAALHVMTSLTGSCIIALAVARGRLSAQEAWAAAHVDEDWQMAQWGADAEAMARRDARWREMAAAARVAELLATNL